MSFRNIKKTLLITILVLLASSRLFAKDNPIDTANLWREILMLEAMFYDTTHLSFNTTVYFTDSSSEITHDTVLIAYKLSKQRYRVILDSTEIIQNDFYHLAVHNDRDIAILSKPIGFGINLFHFRLIDSIFNRLYVQNLHAVDSAGYRKLSFSFKSGSPYAQYDILYDTTNYRISSIEYKILKDPETPGATDHYKVRIVCSGYQTGTFNDSVFSTNSYFIRKQGIYSLVAPYTGYQLINSLNQ
jgi:hypothetical protein